MKLGRRHSEGHGLIPNRIFRTLTDFGLLLLDPFTVDHQVQFHLGI